MEDPMLASLELEPLSLPAQAVHRIENGRGTRVTCIHGVVWVTQERDARDIILTAGQAADLDRPGLAVVFALKPATVTVGTAAEPPPAARLTSRASAYAERAWA
jgi:DUF2917 family protein